MPIKTWEKDIPIKSELSMYVQLTLQLNKMHHKRNMSIEAEKRYTNKK